MKRHLNPPTVIAPQGPYSQGIAVPAGARTVFVAGQGGTAVAPGNPHGILADGLEAQAEQCYRNILHVLAADGMDAGDIVVMTTYVATDLRGMDLILPISRARAKVLGEAAPTGTMVCVSGFAFPEMLIEVNAIATRVD